MTSYIHRVTNESNDFVHVIVFSEHDRLSYDVALGAGQSVAYRDLFGAGSAPVPTATSPSTFPKSHIRLAIGGKLVALYNRDDKVRVSPGGQFSENAPALDGFAGPGPLELVVKPEQKVSGKVVQVLTGPEMAATAWATSRYALYGVDAAAGTLVQKAYLTDYWDGWRSIGAPPPGLRGEVAAVSWVAARYAVYALGRDGVMYEKAWLTDRWAEWVQHPGVVLRNLSAVSWVSGRYGIYAVGVDGNLHQRWWETTQWRGWDNLGRPAQATLAGPITSVSWSTGRYGIYALGSDGNLWQRWVGSGQWSGWETVARPPQPLKTLTSTSWADRYYTVAGVSHDGDLWALEYHHRWQSWKKLGRPATTGLRGPAAAISWRLGVHGYYAQGADGLTYQLYDSKWSVVDGN